MICINKTILLQAATDKQEIIIKNTDGEFPVFESMKRDWKLLKEGEPGHRFQDRYHRRRKREKSNSGYKRFFIIAFGLIIIGIGIIFLFIPGSGWVIIIVGTGFIAGESLTLAKILDVGELMIRKLSGKRHTS